MKNIKTLITLVVCLLLLGCNSQPAEKQKSTIAEVEKPQSGMITVVLQNLEKITPPLEQTSFPTPHISIFNGYYIDTYNNLYRNKGSYTINFDLIKSESLLNINHIDGYVYSYFVEPNDTIIVNFENGLPMAKSNNKNLSEYDLNSSALFYSQYLQYTKFNSFTLPLPFAISKNKQFTSKEYLEILNVKENYLDSLSQEGMISPTILELKKQELEENKSYANIYIPNYELPAKNFDDSKLIYSEYWRLVNTYISHHYIKQNNEDILQVFNSVLLDDKLPKKTKLAYLYGCFEQISIFHLTKEFETTKEQFLKLTQDTLWSELVTKIDHLPQVDSKDLVLYDTNMKEVNFEELINTYKGKVVYLDIWASWCAPCIGSFVVAKELREEYKDKNVVFLYLGFKDNQKDWFRSVEKHKLNEKNAYSFLIASPQAEWLKDLHVTSIPRYMLYDKKGVLVNAKAPTPHKENIREALNKLLK